MAETEPSIEAARTSAEIAFRTKEDHERWNEWTPDLRERLQKPAPVPPWISAGVAYVGELLVAHAALAWREGRHPAEVEKRLKDTLLRIAREVFIEKLQPYERVAESSLNGAAAQFVVRAGDNAKPALAAFFKELWKRQQDRAAQGKSETPEISTDPWRGHYFADRTNGLDEQRCQRCGLDLSFLPQDAVGCPISRVTGSSGEREEQGADEEVPDDGRYHWAVPPSAAADEEKRFKTKAEARTWWAEIKKTHKEGKFDGQLIPVQYLSEYSPGRRTAPSFADFLPVESIAPPRPLTEDAIERELGRAMLDRAYKVNCCLGDDWDSESILAGTRQSSPNYDFEGCRIDGLATQMARVIADLQGQLHARHPALSSFAEADFWLSVEVERFLDEFRQVMSDDPEAQRIVREAGGNPELEVASYVRNAHYFVGRRVLFYANALRSGGTPQNTDRLDAVEVASTTSGGVSMEDEIRQVAGSQARKGDITLLHDSSGELRRSVSFRTAQKYLAIEARQRQYLVKNEKLEVEGMGHNKKIMVDSLLMYLPPENTHKPALTRTGTK